MNCSGVWPATRDAGCGAGRKAEDQRTRRPSERPRAARLAFQLPRLALLLRPRPAPPPALAQPRCASGTAPRLDAVPFRQPSDAGAPQHLLDDVGLELAAELPPPPVSTHRRPPVSCGSFPSNSSMSICCSPILASSTATVWPAGRC